MIGGQVANGGDAIRQRVASARTLLLESRLKPVRAELQSVLGLHAICVASEVCDEGVEGRHCGDVVTPSGEDPGYIRIIYTRRKERIEEFQRDGDELKDKL